MKNKTVVELQEMLNRQQKLVENSALLRKLPDKLVHLLLYEHEHKVDDMERK